MIIRIMITIIVRIISITIIIVMTIHIFSIMIILTLITSNVNTTHHQGFPAALLLLVVRPQFRVVHSQISKHQCKQYLDPQSM